ESPAQGFVRWPLQASGEAALRVDLYSAGHGSPLKAATVPHAGATVAVAICAVWADGVGPRHAGDDRARQCGGVQARVEQIGIGQIGVGEVGVGQGGEGQVSGGEVGVGQVGEGQVGGDHQRVTQIGID